MPSAPGSPLRLAPLVLIGAVLPAVFVALDTSLLQSWSIAPLMAALVAEVGLMGPLCAGLIRPRWLMWLIYAWMWLVMDVIVLALAIDDPWYGEAISPTTLPMGMLSGQLGLVLVWGALGQLRWNIRWPAAFLLGIAILIPIVWHQMHPTELLILVALQSAILIAVCWWLAWRGFRMVRLQSAGDNPLVSPIGRPAGQPRESQFQLRDLLIWTTALAIALAVARMVNYWSASINVLEHIQSFVVTKRMQAFLLGSPTAAIVTAAVLLVALWAALGHGRPLVRWFYLFVFVGVVSTVHGVIDYYQHAWAWRWARPLWQSWDFFWHLEQTLVVWHCLTGGMLFAALLMFRSLGYRLNRVRSSGSRKATTRLERQPNG